MDEAALLQRALAGDAAAMEALTRLLTPPIQARVARTLCRRPGHKGDLGRDLEDLMQEVFVRLFAENARALRAWDPDRGLSLVGFVRMVADREVSNVFASGRRQPSAERLELEENMDLHARSTAPDEERRAIDRDLLLKVYRELQTWLTPRGRELFTVVYLEQRTRLAPDPVSPGIERTALHLEAFSDLFERTLLEINDGKELPSAGGQPGLQLSV
ncbi:MAG: hypothetical protein AAFN74_26770, partial [Myxococcota bacterium]